MTVELQPLTTHHEFPPDEMVARATAFRADLQRRRTVRDYAPREVDRAVIEECIRAAGTAPSGANMQPWHFVAVSDPTTKTRIREAAEIEEREFYDNGRAPQEWLDALAHLGTDSSKPFLEIAPWLIVVFAQKYGLTPNGSRTKNYYVQESVGIATGMLITALHSAGLATLTHTPSPMGFLQELLGRPDNERAYLILVTGHPATDAAVPRITKKPLSDFATFL
jgi:iodotyrosine deiodinase